MMRFRSWGDEGKPLVVLLHALGCHSGWWEWTAPALARDYRVVAPDFRGHGDTPPADDYGYAAYAADVEELVRSLGGELYGLIGHSLGGYVAMTVAARGHVKPAALVVADMKMGATPDELAAWSAAAAKPPRTFPTLEEAVARYRLMPEQHRVPPDRLSRVAAESYRPAEGGTWVEKFDRRALAIEPVTPMDLAGSLGCPALFIRGENSTVMEHQAALTMARSIGSALMVMLGLFHHLPLEGPELLAKTLARFLDEPEG